MLHTLKPQTQGRSIIDRYPTLDASTPILQGVKIPPIDENPTLTSLAPEPILLKY
jgi:hypothetical protein